MATTQNASALDRTDLMLLAQLQRDEMVPQGQRGQ